jgi:hypothetical protein
VAGLVPDTLYPGRRQGESPERVVIVHPRCIVGGAGDVGCIASEAIYAIPD